MTATAPRMKSRARTPSPSASANSSKNVSALIGFRRYQERVFWCLLGLLVLHWSRQIGKSYVLAAWAVFRCLTKPGRLVTVLSNSKMNGAEFIQKCTQICRLLQIACEDEDLSPDEFIENMRVECRIKVEGKWGRIIVLAANPRTARGFSGDLILDEFAFHDDSAAIWDAAEPILSSNEDFQARVSSTGNGRYNMFYQLAGVNDFAARLMGFNVSVSGAPVSRVSRTDAHADGVKVYDRITREAITPEQARERSLDKASYDQNYELSFNDEAMSLLTYDLIQRAEYLRGADSKLECFIDSEAWSPRTLEFLRSLPGPLGLGMDVGRNRNLSSVAIGEKHGQMIFTRALLRMSNKRLPYQVEQLKPVLAMSNFGRGEIDYTGIGVGLTEFAQDEVGGYRINGVNFATKEHRILNGVQTEDTALVTELMALAGLNAFEGGRIRIPMEQALRESLRKPMRIQSGNRIMIAAENDDTGHADEFWSIMLMIRALEAAPGVITSTKGIVIGGHRAGVPRHIPRKLQGGRR